MVHWEDTQKKVKKLVEDGMKLIKEGVKEAEYISGATLDATRFHLQKKKDQLEKERAFHRLGKICFGAYNTKANNINLNSEAADIIKKIQNLMKDEKELEGKISKLSIINPSKCKKGPCGK